MHLLVPPWSILDKSQPPAKVPVYRLWGSFGKSKWELFADIQSMVLNEGGSCSRATWLVSSPRLTRVALPNLCILSHPSSNSTRWPKCSWPTKSNLEKIRSGYICLILMHSFISSSTSFFPEYSQRSPYNKPATPESLSSFGWLKLHLLTSSPKTRKKFLVSFHWFPPTLGIHLHLDTKANRKFNPAHPIFCQLIEQILSRVSKYRLVKIKWIQRLENRM